MSFSIFNRRVFRTQARCRNAKACYHPSIPVVFLPSIQSGDLPHLIIAEFETKQVKILPDMLRIGGSGNYHNTALEIPAQDDLCGRNTMGRSNCTDRVIAQQLKPLLMREILFGSLKNGGNVNIGLLDDFTIGLLPSSEESSNSK